MIAGQKMYIITSPKDISSVYKNPQVLTFDGFIKDVYVNFGMSSTGVAQIFEPVTFKDGKTSSPLGQQYAHLATGIQREQLHPGENLDNLIETYLTYIEQQMDWDKLPDSCIMQSLPGKKVVSLRNWCADVLGRATAQAFIGAALLEVDPHLLEDFHTFDSNSWMLLYQYPRIFAKPMFEAIERNTQAFTRYFQLPVEKRDQMCHYIKTVEGKQRKAGMSDRDIAISAQCFFWAYVM